MKIRSNIALSESGFVFNPDTGESFTVNPMGHEILELARQGNGFEQIRESILQKYKVDEHIFEKDFEDFLSQLDHFQITTGDEEA